MNWELFRKRFFHYGLVDERKRPRTMKALKIVASKLPENTLLGKYIAVVAQGKSTMGLSFAGQGWAFIFLYSCILVSKSYHNVSLTA